MRTRTGGTRSSTTEHPWYVQALEAGAEVARVELKEDVDIERYANVPLA